MVLDVKSANVNEKKFYKSKKVASNLPKLADKNKFLTFFQYPKMSLLHLYIGVKY